MILKSTNGSVTGFGQNENMGPNEFSLKQNYPNPFNPVTKISFHIPNDGYAKLTVYDITGKEISVLIEGELETGQIWSRPILTGVTFQAVCISTGCRPMNFHRQEK